MESLTVPRCFLCLQFAIHLSQSKRPVSDWLQLEKLAEGLRGLLAMAANAALVAHARAIAVPRSSVPVH